MRLLRWALLATLSVGAARAELESADYAPQGKAVPAGRAREQIRIDIARDLEQQARQAQREAEQAAQQRARAEAEEARRPYPERLLHARCSTCHPLDAVLHPRHGWLGWQVVILRMRLFNRAPLDNAEQQVLAVELTRLRPAPPAVAALEIAAAALLAAAPLALAWALRRRRSRR